MATKTAGWTLHISGTHDDPTDNTVTLIREGPRQRLRLEIDAPGVLSGPGELDDRVRQRVQDALDALQGALDSPSGLPLRRFPKL